MIRTDRGVSTGVSYALVIAISLVLTTGLVFGASSLVEQNQRSVTNQQTQVVGQQLAATLVHADRLAATEPEPRNLAITRRFPTRVAGSQYRITLTPAPGTVPTINRTVITLRPVASDAVARTNVSTSLQVGPAGGTTVLGGDVRVIYDPATDRLEVRNV